jgi:flagellar hook-associated protein 3 FlgL
MRIPNYTVSQTLVARLQDLTARQANLNQQATTGQRITDPSDDPAAMGRVLNIQTEKTQIQQFSRNNDRALNISQSSFTAVEQLKKTSDRVSELTVLGSGTAGPDALRTYATEVNGLLDQALQIANTKYAGEHIFGGTRTDTPPFTAVRDANGHITSVSYVGAASGPEVRTSEGGKVEPFTDGAQNQQFADFINRIVVLRDALQTGDVGNVLAARPALDTSEDELVVTIADIGAKQTRLEIDRTQNAARFAELEKLMGAETDADLSEVLVELRQTQTAYQAALQSGSQALSMSLLDYLR